MNRDRWNELEGDSGSAFNDVIRGDSAGDLAQHRAHLILAADVPADREEQDPADPSMTDAVEDLAGRLTAAIEKESVRESLEQLAPSHPQYRGLQAALALETDPARAALIRMNMERWRWAPRQLGDRYVLINVPAYVMQVMEGERPALSMRVIVGEPDHQTPLFSDEMTHVVFSPYWNIPPTIAKDETLPAVAKDPAFLERQNIEIVRVAGNAADPVTRTVKVIYDFAGFFSPVNNPPAINLMNAGRTVAVKFSLAGNQGLGIMAAGSPYSQQVSCSTSAPIYDIEGAETSGNSTLTYDAGSNQYHYNWKTESSWAGTCRILSVASSGVVAADAGEGAGERPVAS